MYGTAKMNNAFIIIALIVGALLYLLAPILTPFLIGAILAYLGDPLVNLLMRFKLPRNACVVIVFVVLFTVLVLLGLFLIPLIENQLVLLCEVLPRAAVWLQNTLLPLLKEYIGNQEIINIDMLKTTLAQNWVKAGGTAAWMLKSVLHSGVAFVQWMINLLLIPVVTFYLLRDWDKLIKGVRLLLPRRFEPTIVKLVVECNDVLSAFFRGQLLVMLSLAVFYSIGLTLVGLQVGVMIGLIAGLLYIVPYLGVTIGIVIASIVAYMQFGHLSSVSYVWFVFLIGQILEGTLLTPNLVGNRIGLHPVAVIFSILTGGELFGFFGVLLALPMAAVIMVLIRFFFQRYRNSQAYR